jgi:hypothetical protein
MSSVQIDQKRYEMPPREGISIAQFLTVADYPLCTLTRVKLSNKTSMSIGPRNFL